ncbi:hypothetical protein [Clostridium estertheticum]|uniref:Uncharacterized protein n=1 Tax=Clostridium estertheticum subsp. estertheticum TaxID=1552 RepID=A0A1J0GED9_9CLOT|nr:hypothetical protein [Clostridium estertheticum]APC39659.1 hypothetical protein A7L45_06055 [Clostridium estertheticum subsp. estertheticum]MBZ9614303.1 hypothetical protein [Clostridium estertheticum subsp. laramiense]WAG74241.1 hypothetical protein LL032_01935 [Clostridium estertheticum]
MIGTVWNNGTYDSSGVGYGIKIQQTDRDKYFNKDWMRNMIKSINFIHENMVTSWLAKMCIV